MTPPIRVRRGDAIEISVHAFPLEGGHMHTNWEVHLGTGDVPARRMRRASTLSRERLTREFFDGGAKAGKVVSPSPSSPQNKAMKSSKKQKKNAGRKDKFPRRRVDIVRRQVDEEMLLFDPKSQQAHFLNPTADLIWELCDGARSVDKIAGEIAARFNVEAGRAAGDVRNVLEEFRGKQLLAL